MAGLFIRFSNCHPEQSEKPLSPGLS